MSKAWGMPYWYQLFRFLTSCPRDMYDILSTTIVLRWKSVVLDLLISLIDFLFMLENLNLRKKSFLLFVAKLMEWRWQPQLVPFSVLHWQTHISTIVRFNMVCLVWLACNDKDYFSLLMWIWIFGSVMFLLSCGRDLQFPLSFGVVGDLSDESHAD